MSETTQKAREMKIQARLDAWDATLQSYRVRAREADADVGIKLEQEICQLEAQRNEITRKLESLRKSEADDWSEIDNALDAIADEIDQGLQSVASRFK